MFSRAAADAALLTGFGTALLRAVLPETRTAAALNLQRGAALAACGALLVWLAAVTQSLAGAVAVPSLVLVLRATLFGHTVALQGVFCVAALAAAPRPRIAALCTGGALALTGLHAHAGVNPAAAPAAAELAHVFAAGAWLGGLPALVLALRAAPAAGALAAPEAASALAARYVRLGTAAVCLLALSVLGQYACMIGSLHALATTAYGRLALGKTALLLGLLVLAANNRWRLARARPHRLARAVAAECALGAAVVLLAATLGQTPPPRPPGLAQAAHASTTRR